MASGVSIMYFVLLSYTMAGAKSDGPGSPAAGPQAWAFPGWKVFVEIIGAERVAGHIRRPAPGHDLHRARRDHRGTDRVGGKGLGTLVSYYSNTFDPNGVFATLIVLVIITTGLTAAMVQDRTVHHEVACADHGVMVQAVWWCRVNQTDLLVSNRLDNV